MKIFIIVLTLFLTGCACEPVIKNVDRIVQVSTPVPCKIKPVDKPDFPVDRLKKEDTLTTKTSAALAELERRKAYEKELEAAIKECQ